MTGAAITLAGAIEALVCEKQAVGYKYQSEAKVLQRFEAFCASEFPGLQTLTEASVQAWLEAARRRGVTPATLQALAAPIRELARWLSRHGTAAYLLPRASLPRPARYVPHIYTDSELAALFSATDRCHYCSEVPLRHLIMPVLFRTMYACGLRCSEARLLHVSDADIDAGVLQIRDAKGGKDRQLPVSAPLREKVGWLRASRRANRQARGGVVLPWQQTRRAAGADERQPQLPAVSVAGRDLPRRSRARTPCP